MTGGAAGALGRAPAPPPADGGAATVLAAVLILGLVAIAGFGLALGSVMLARHRAEGAADLAALAAAPRVPQGGEPACGAAAVVAEAMRAHLEDCALDGADVRVVVAVRAPSGLGVLSPQVTGRAMAGPVVR